MEDTIVWTGNTNVKFSVKSLYCFLTDSGDPSFPASQIWLSSIPPRVAFFTWTATWGKCLTLDLLQMKGFELPNWCVMCEESLESIDHLLMHCTVAAGLWTFCLGIFRVLWVLPSTVRQLLGSWRCRTINKLGLKAWRLVPHAIFWTIWRERNNRTFEDREATFEFLKNTCIRLLFCWSGSELFDSRMHLQDFWTPCLY